MPMTERTFSLVLVVTGEHFLTPYREFEYQLTRVRVYQII
jgi:hypothetical protein